jgi:hypothetical protein
MLVNLNKFYLLFALVACVDTSNKGHLELTTSKKKIKLKEGFYKDFDWINASGKNPIQEKNLSFPYIEIKKINEIFYNVVFHKSKDSTYTKEFKYLDSTLTSTVQYFDSKECSKLIGIQFFFDDNRRITYYFCNKVDFLQKKLVKKIEIDTLHDSVGMHFVSKSTLLNSFRNNTNEYLFTFDPFHDFDGPTFHQPGSFIRQETHSGLSAYRNVSFYNYFVKNDSSVEIAFQDEIKKVLESDFLVWDYLDFEIGI